MNDHPNTNAWAGFLYVVAKVLVQVELDGYQGRLADNFLGRLRLQIRSEDIENPRIPDYERSQMLGLFEELEDSILHPPDSSSRQSVSLATILAEVVLQFDLAPRPRPLSLHIARFLKDRIDQLGSLPEPIPEADLQSLCRLSDRLVHDVEQERRRRGLA